jgi:hypothetical protein
MQVCVRTLVGKNLSIDLDESPDTATVAMIKEALQVCFFGPLIYSRLPVDPDFVDTCPNEIFKGSI